VQALTGGCDDAVTIISCCRLLARAEHSRAWVAGKLWPPVASNILNA